MAQHAHDCIYHCFVISLLLSNFLSNSSCFSNPPFFEDVTRAIAKQIGVCSSALKHAFAFYISANCISLSKLYENDYVKFFKIKGPPLTPLRTICWESIWHVGNLSMYSFIIPSKSKILAILSMWHFRQNSYSKLWPHRPLFPNWHYSLAIATWTKIVHSSCAASTIFRITKSGTYKHYNETISPTRIFIHWITAEASSPSPNYSICSSFCHC